MSRKITKKKNSGGRHRQSDQLGAPPVPMDVLVDQGAYSPDRMGGSEAVPERAKTGGAETPPSALVPLLLTVEQACVLLGVSRAHFFRLKKAGKVPGCVNLGGLVRYRREDLETWVKQLQPSP